MIRAEPFPAELPRAPKWARPEGNFREHSGAEALYFAGAAQAAVDLFVRSDPPWAGAWRRRLALKSAAAVVQNLLNRCEDEAALRDAVALAKPGHELGPAGKVYSAFRTLTDRGDLFRPERLAAVAMDLQAPLELDRTGELGATIREASGHGRPAPVAAAAAAEAAMKLRPGAEPLALYCADAALAKSLDWQVPLPLLAGESLCAAARARGGGPSPARPAGAGPWRSPTPAPRFRPSISPRICPAARPGSWR
jgi:hypothetical protein